jgi:glycosyltransferase involved in cell wall biosynthesis
MAMDVVTDLGVYISTLDEEVLIEAALENVVKVFPQVELIDLGSTDKTLESVKRLGVPINQHILTPKTSKHSTDGPAHQWIALKNKYADKHDWIFMIDGDEIWDEENLLKLKAKWENRPESITGIRIGWRTVREVNGQKQISPMKANGPKLYDSSVHRFRRGWPKEVLGAKGDHIRVMAPKDECDVWCWHGVLLLRTESVPEAGARKAKRLKRWKYYDEQLEWEDVDKWPWT